MTSPILGAGRTTACPITVRRSINMIEIKAFPSPVPNRVKSEIQWVQIR